jgi:hypothetical protein
MRIKVTAQIPATSFRGSEWEDPTEASQEFVRFAEEVWREDLEPLQAMGIGVTVSVGVTPPENQPQPGVEVHVEPYQSDTVDMMKQTREMLTTQAEVWVRFQRSPAAKVLFRG